MKKFGFILLLLTIFNFSCAIEQNIVPNIPQASASPTVLPTGTYQPSITPTVQPTASTSPVPNPQATPIPFDSNKKIEGKQISFVTVSSDKCGEMINTATGLRKTCYLGTNNKVNLSSNIVFLDNSFSNEVEWLSSNKNILSIDSNGKAEVGSESGNVEITLLSKKERIPLVPARFIVVPCNLPGPCSFIGDPVLATVSGTVYDINGIPLSGVKINAKSIIQASAWMSQETITDSSGHFVLRSVPIEIKIEVVASKEGWITKKREIMTEQNTQDSSNIVNFGGNMNENIYALEPLNK
jgi:hypothetical protein